MKPLGLNQIREAFLSFYESKEHYRQKSFSLIPAKDKSLLIINSGMAPLKPYFSGAEQPPAKRMVTCQKCIRTGDIDNVGLTSRHGTFFEMLGSFSFGDYFKTESLLWGWEFITKVLELPEDKLWATIYENDEEAYEIWTNKVGIDPGKIVRLGKKDNFWEIGTGPCGPCSEIYFDRGPEYGCDDPDCKPGCECDRYIEFWNHVFTQFSRDEQGNYTDLAHPNIDTGMGLERIACILQDVDSIFAVDTLQAILNAVVKKSGVAYEGGKQKTDISIRIITDHIRSITFMIGDGILPGNEGRGYVLRRLLRRAARHGKLLGIDGVFLAPLALEVIKVSGESYPELVEKSASIEKIIRAEEEKFTSTIDQGMRILEEFMEALKQEGISELPGEKVFKLYDTYGFPPELTEEILTENSFTLALEGFHSHMQQQKELARSARKADEDAGWLSDDVKALVGAETLFTGDKKLEDIGKITGVLSKEAGETSVSAGQIAKITLDRTPFYGESGGQAGDTGIICGENFKAEVLETDKVGKTIIHKVEVMEGLLSLGDAVTTTVSALDRNSIARNHTATHLLHKALQQVVGQHVQQAGSSVSKDSLRFDFTHFEAVSKEDLKKVEDIVNRQILLFLPVTAEETDMETAKKAGAAALFGEKYGDTVRMVSVGEFSKELCGGTHVKSSGEIGAFKIITEGGVAAGVRRIEAITGMGLLERFKELEVVLSQGTELLKASSQNFLIKLAQFTEEWKHTKKELEELKKQSMGSMAEQLIKEALQPSDSSDTKLIVKAFEGMDVGQMRTISDDIKAGYKGVVMVFASSGEGKVTFLVSVTDDLLDKGYHAGNLIKQIAAVAGGSGGGKADMAQAGAKDPGKIPEALNFAKELITSLGK